MPLSLSSVNACREILQEMLSKMNIECEQTTRATEEMIFINLEGGNAKDLIGHRGDTLAAFQTMLSMLLSRRVKERIYVAIDVNGYRERREQALTAMAKRAAEEVIVSGKPLTLEPMLPYERRIVHMVLQGYPEVRSESEGEEPERRVVILPAVAPVSSQSDNGANV